MKFSDPLTNQIHLRKKVENYLTNLDNPELFPFWFRKEGYQTASTVIRDKILAKYNNKILDTKIFFLVATKSLKVFLERIKMGTVGQSIKTF